MIQEVLKLMDRLLADGEKMRVDGVAPKGATTAFFKEAKECLEDETSAKIADVVKFLRD